MAEFLVSGYYGDKNAGDEAILAGMIGAIRALEPDASFTVISKKAAYTRALHGVKAVSRNDFRATWRAIGAADVVISGGGSLLQDVTSTKSLLYYLGVMSMARLRGKPVMIYAQGIGPVVTPVGRTLVGSVVNHVDRITVRDPESARTLKMLGVTRPPVTITADPALGLGPSDPEAGARLLRDAGVRLDRPLIGVSVRAWKAGDGRRWEPALAHALDRLVKETGAGVVFIPLQQQRDVEAASVVAGLMESPGTLVTGDRTHAEVRAMIARCDLVIGVRFHALVFAAMNGVPLVGLSYDPKNDSFLRSLGEEAAGAMHNLKPDAVLSAARKALENVGAFRARLQQRMAEMTPHAVANAQAAVELLKQRRSRR